MRVRGVGVKCQQPADVQRRHTAQCTVYKIIMIYDILDIGFALGSWFRQAEIKMVMKCARYS